MQEHESCLGDGKLYHSKHMRVVSCHALHTPSASWESGGTARAASWSVSRADHHLRPEINVLIPKGKEVGSGNFIVFFETLNINYSITLRWSHPKRR